MPININIKRVKEATISVNGDQTIMVLFTCTIITILNFDQLLFFQQWHRPLRTQLLGYLGISQLNPYSLHITHYKCETLNV